MGWFVEGHSRSFRVVDEEPGLAVQEQSEFWLDMCLFDDNSRVLWHKVYGRALGSSTHTALIETCPDIGPVLGFYFEEIRGLQIAELVWFGFEADMA